MDETKAIAAVRELQAQFSQRRSQALNEDNPIARLTARADNLEWFAARLMEILLDE